MNRALRDSLFELYIDAGVELMALGARGIKRELVLDLETSALTPEIGEIIRFRAVNRWDEYDEFDVWAKPAIPLTVEAERILDVTNEQLARCTSTDLVLDEFLDFIDGAELVGDRLDFDLAFLKTAIAQSNRGF